MSNVFIPHEYQQIGIEHIIRHASAGLFLEMGLGKTVTTLTAFQELKYGYLAANRAIVIAPKFVAQYTWPDEIDKWDHLALSYAVAVGRPAERLAALNSNVDMVFINRENVAWLHGVIAKGQLKIPFDTLIIDELSSFKNNNSQRWRALKKLQPLFRRVIGLTGTPTPNGLIDLWPQMYLLDRGARLGKNVTAFRQRYFYPSVVNPNNARIVFKWDIRGPEAEKEIYDRIGDIVLSMQACDYLEMPDKVINRVYVDMSAAERAKYETLERDYVLAAVSGDEDSMIVADNAAALTNKLLQISNGYVYGPDKPGEEREQFRIHSRKVEALETLIEGANGKPVLVFYSFQTDLEAIKEAFPQAITVKEGGPDVVRRWNAGEIPILLAHPASAGHGLNLQHGGSTIIWYGLTWSLELYQQANARLHRQGQTDTVYIHHIMTRGTIEDDVMKALEEKGDVQDRVYTELKKKLVDFNKKP